MTTLGSGHYTYTLQENWAKLPEGETFAMVSAIATDSQDRVYAFQRKEPPVLIFDRDGNLQDSWGNGSFLFAHGFYIEDDVVYVTDRDASTCLVYTLDGKPVQMLGRHGRHSDTGCEVAGDLVPRAAGPFNYPAELVPSPSGELYVADGYRNSRVHRFTGEGELIQSWGEPGKSEANHFHLPHSLIIDGDRIIVCGPRETTASSSSPSTASSSSSGTTSSAPWTSPATLRAIFLVSEGTVNDSSARISILDPQGGVLARFDCRGSGHGSWIDSRGDIYLAGVPDAIDKYVREG